MTWQLRVRKLCCRNKKCPRRIFTERLPVLVAAYGHKTFRLVATLRAIGMALGGNPGARLAARLRVPISAATLLRLVRGLRYRPCEAYKRSVSTSGPGGGATAMAPSSLIS